MKKILALLLTVALLGCEKDKKGTEPMDLPKGVYLKQFIRYHYEHPEFPYLGYDEFSYNNSGELFKRETITNGKVTETRLLENSPGRISVSEYVEKEKLTGTSVLYLKDNKLDRVERAALGSVKLSGFFVTEYFFYGSDNKISYSTFFESRSYFEFDKRGNINKIKYYSSGDTIPTAVHTIEYDDKQNPFYLLDPSIGVDDVYLSLQHPTFNYLYYLCPNNLVSISSTFSYTGPKELNWTYTYNEFDYPVRKYFVKDPSQAGDIDTMYYEYHIVE